MAHLCCTGCTEDSTIVTEVSCERDNDPIHDQVFCIMKTSGVWLV